MILKKTTGILLLFSFIFSVTLSGCSIGNWFSSNNSSTTVQEPGSLTLWTHKKAFEKGFQAVADKFYREKGIKVNIEVIEGDDPYKAKLSTAGKEKKLPDIYVVWASVGESFPGEFDKNTVLEMTDKVDAAWKKTFLPHSWDKVIISQNDVDQWKKDTNAPATIKSLKVGQFFGVPLDVGSFYMFYGNKKLVERAGFKAEAPKTYEDFIDEMRDIRAFTNTPGLVYGGSFPDIWWNWAGTALMTMANGEGSYRNLLRRNEKEQMADEKNVRVLHALNNTVKAKVIMPGVVDMNIEEANAAFANNKAAFELGGSFTMSDLIYNGMRAEDIFTFSVPPLEDSKYTEWKDAPLALLQMRVPTYTKHQKEAMDFIKYITSPDGALIFESATYDVSAIDLSSVQDKRAPAMQEMFRLFHFEDGYLANMDEHPVNYRANNEWRILDNGCKDLLKGITTPEDIAKAFDTQMDAERAREAAIDAAKH